MAHFSLRKGFTLLEILLVVAALGILITGMLLIIDPDERLRNVERVSREGDVKTIENALREYFLTNRSYPAGVDSTSIEICNTGDSNDSINCTGLLNLESLVPEYLVSIPVSDLATGSRTGYTVFLDSGSQLVVSSLADPVEEVEEIAINPNVTRVNIYNVSTGNNSTQTMSFTPTEGNLLVVMAGHRESPGAPTISGDWNLAFYECTYTSNGDCSADTGTDYRRGFAMWWKVVDASTPNTIQINWNPGLSTQRISVQEYSFSPEVSQVSLNDHYVVNSYTSSVNQLSIPNVNIPQYSLVVSGVFMRGEIGSLNTWNSSIVDNANTQIAFGDSRSMAHSFGIADTTNTYAISPTWSNNRESTLGTMVFTFQ